MKILNYKKGKEKIQVRQGIDIPEHEIKRMAMFIENYVNVSTWHTGFGSKDKRPLKRNIVAYGYNVNSDETFPKTLLEARPENVNIARYNEFAIAFKEVCDHLIFNLDGSPIEGVWIDAKTQEWFDWHLESLERQVKESNPTKVVDGHITINTRLPKSLNHTTERPEATTIGNIELLTVMMYAVLTETKCPWIDIALTMIVNETFSNCMYVLSGKGNNRFSLPPNNFISIVLDTTEYKPSQVAYQSYRWVKYLATGSRSASIGELNRLLMYNKFAFVSNPDRIEFSYLHLMLNLYSTSFAYHVVEQFTGSLFNSKYLKNPILTQTDYEPLSKEFYDLQYVGISEHLSDYDPRRSAKPIPKEIITAGNLRLSKRLRKAEKRNKKQVRAILDHVRSSPNIALAKITPTTTSYTFEEN